MKERILQALSNELRDYLLPAEIEKAVEIPPSDNLGDYAFPCFALSRQLKKSPAVIAADIKDRLMQSGGLNDDSGVRIEIIGGYLNFFIDKRRLAESVIQSLTDGSFGVGNINERVVVEFASPNTNKPLHLGHLRNMSIGDSIARILKFCGCEVFRANINNDRGVHICKSMLAYDRCGNGATPENTAIKPDRFVGDYYVMFNNKSTEDPSWNDDAQNMLKDWEDGDPKILDLWKKMNTWALDGFRDTYRLFGIAFDKEYYESDIYKNGKEIVRHGIDKGVFNTREDGAVFVDLEVEKLGTKVLLRPDGTSVYIVQDLYLALLKDKDFAYNKSYYVVGNEQEHHFAQLIAIFKKLGYDIAEKMKHLSYGMVELPEGKMKSREGTVVDADDLIKETQNLARQEIIERFEGLAEEQVEDRSLKIALAAIKYQLLKIDITKNMIFDPKKAIGFEGDTGPYLLYSYARASSIIRKAGGIPAVHIIPAELESGEIKLVKKIAFFPSAAGYAYERLSPSVITNYAFELAQTFNEFYHAHQVIGSGNDVENFRVNLVAAFRVIIGKCLLLLGIETIEEM